MRLLLLALSLATPLAAYSYLVSSTFTGGIDTQLWQTNGTIGTNSSYGLTTTDSTGGAVISNTPMPANALRGVGTDMEYEIAAKFRITASGGTFVLYSRASMNARSGPSPQGTFYAAEFSPTLTTGGCTMAVQYYRVVAAVATLLQNQTQACKDGMMVRWTQRSGYSAVSTSLEEPYTVTNELYVIYDSTLGAGRPGFGGRGLPAGNAISIGSAGPLEYVTPGLIDGSSLRTSLFENRVDLAWAGVIDEPNGSGFMMYFVTRDGAFLGNVRGGYFSDPAVIAGETYTYTIYPHDVHLNYSTRAVTITVPGTGQKDPRKVGVRPLGTYWGASPENIDLQSGNLSFSLPVVTAQGRGGTSLPFRMSYNSQNWRKDANWAWKLGTDVGFGWGWKMLAGSLTPFYTNWYSIDHFQFIDSTGAEYTLRDPGNTGIWTSTEGIYVEYDAAARRLYFPSGSFWEFDCIANGTEEDSGTMYPTRVVDTNGNEIKMKYQGGMYFGGVNGSARVTAVEDVRAVMESGGYRSYRFNYSVETLPHLISVTSDIGDGVSLGFSYTGGLALIDPFTNTNYGAAHRLNSLTLPGGTGQFTMEYTSGSLELKKATMPRGGTLEWEYEGKTLAGNRTHMEVKTRKLNAQHPAPQATRSYTFTHDDAGDASRLAHLFTVVLDASTAADKAYYFHVTSDYRLGLFSSLYERKTAGFTTLRSTAVTWTQTGNGNPYIAERVETLDPNDAGGKKTKTEQTVDDHGNMTLRREYGYAAPGGTPALFRTFTYCYLASGICDTYPLWVSSYRARHIWNRLIQVTMQKAGGSPVPLVTNMYDVYQYNNAGTVANLSLLRQHDTATYNDGMVYRGNLTNSTTISKTLKYFYDLTGNLVQTSDNYGHSAGRFMDENRNYSVPRAIIGGSLQSTLSWNSYHAPLSATGPNVDTMSFSYDGYARPETRTEANGSVSTMTYGTSAPYWTKATTGSRWMTTWVDGFGRPYKTESGFGGTTVSVTDTEYAPCACTPMGKLFRTSLPHAPGASTVLWTEHYYDALGRTVEVRQPSGSGSTYYSYLGSTVMVTDPAGPDNWKKSEADAQGNLVKVTEPQPGSTTLFYETFYTYSEYGQLLTVSMTRPGLGAGNAATVTQTRTWVYDASQRLQSVTHPESGTTVYEYNPDGSLKKKTDAKQQRVEFTYDTDGRVTAARRYLTGGVQEDLCGRVDYYYGTQPFAASFTLNAAGRLAATRTGCLHFGAGQLIEMYSYTAAGAVSKKRLRMERPDGTVDKDVTYGYAADGKLATVLYPGATVPYSYTYDLMDRPIKMTGPSAVGGNVVDHAKDVNYGVAGQVTSMSYMQGESEGYAPNGDLIGLPNFLTETRQYNPLFQLTRQSAVTNAVGTVADIEYVFPAAGNNGRIAQRKNNVSQQVVNYVYDALNRLESAANTGTGAWAQTFTYDGFGNLRAQDATLGTAPEIMDIGVNMTNNRLTQAGWSYDLNGNATSMPVVGGGNATLSYDVDNRLVRWDGPSGGTEFYGYLPDNKRVWKKAPSGAETVYFYGVGGQKLVTYTVQASPFVLFEQARNVYFGGKLIRADGNAVVHDRLGSVVWRSGVGAKDYFPYGEEIGGASAGNVDKFGTYHRDATTGLDYADQRYFTSLSGRYLTEDPCRLADSPRNPVTWNRYTYVLGDPVNFNDPSGLVVEQSPDGCMGGSGPGGGIGDGAGGDSGGDSLLPGRPSIRTKPWDDIANWAINVAILTNAFNAGRASNEALGMPYVTHLSVEVDCYVSNDSTAAGHRTRRRKYVAYQGNVSLEGNANVSIQELVLGGNGQFATFIGDTYTVGSNGIFSDRLAQGLNPVNDTAYQYFQVTIAGTPFVSIPVPILGYGAYLQLGFNYVSGTSGAGDNITINNDSGFSGLHECTPQELRRWAGTL